YLVKVLFQFMFQFLPQNRTHRPMRMLTQSLHEPAAKRMTEMTAQPSRQAPLLFDRERGAFRAHHLIKAMRSDDCLRSASGAKAHGERSVPMHVTGLPRREFGADIDALEMDDAIAHILQALHELCGIEFDFKH